MIKIDIPRLVFWLKKQPLKFLRLTHIIDNNEYKKRKSILDETHPRFQYKKAYFPNNAQSQIWQNKSPVISHSHRAAIFAGFSHNGKIYDADIYYLQELKKVCDLIVVFYDSPIIPSEVEKIKDIVHYANFNRHNEYDFGSYKRGWQYLSEQKLLENIDELIVCNNSCYGSIYPFAQSLKTMSAKNVDFWGMVSGQHYQSHIQSYFYLFTKKVFEHPAFNAFLQKVKHEEKFMDVVKKYECQFTKHLSQQGFTWDTLVSASFNLDTDNDNTYPIKSITDFQLPLLKVKVLSEKGFCREELPALLDLLYKENASLAEVIKNDPRNKLCKRVAV